MINERRIEGILTDIRDAIVYHADSIDYSGYIRDLKHIINKLRIAKFKSVDYQQQARLTNLECRAVTILNAAYNLQASYENQR